MAQFTRGSGRPRQAVLTRELILQTALRLLDERGAAGTGIRELARELGVRPSALYNHISGQDDLIDGIRELVSDRIDVSCFQAASWEEALRCWAHSYRSAFAAHPPTIALLAVRPLRPGSRTTGMYDTVCRALVNFGWPEDRVLTVVVALENFILGSALDASAPDTMLDPHGTPEATAFRGAYDARGALLQSSNERPADAAFAVGLDAIIAGLRVEFAGLARAG